MSSMSWISFTVSSELVQLNEFDELAKLYLSLISWLKDEFEVG